MSSQSASIRTARFKYLKNSGTVPYSVSSVVLIDGGIGCYAVGDSFVIPGARLGGNGSNALTLTVSTVTTIGTILTYTVSGDGADTTVDIIFPIHVGSMLYDYALSITATRDASDMTKMIKERIMYNEKKTGSPIIRNKAGFAGNAEVLWQPQGNQFRLSYLFGKVKCGGCANGGGGAFNLNGPLQAS